MKLLFQRLLDLSARNFLLLLFACAFVVRWGGVLALRNPYEFHGQAPAGADAVDYNVTGLNLANGEGYAKVPGRPYTFRAPGFPFLLAALYRISYENYFLVYIAQCLLGSLTSVLVYFLAREVLPNFKARIAALFYVIYFPAIYLCTLFVSEPLFSLCLALAIVFFLRYLRNGSVADLSGSGLALSYSVLTRPFAILLLPAFISICAISLFWKRRLRMAHLIAFTLAGLAVIIPWTLRNYRVHRTFVLISTTGGATFYGGNNDFVLHEPRDWGGWISTARLPGRATIETSPDEVTRDRIAWRLGFQWVRNNVIQMPLLLVFKFVRFWLPDISSGNRRFVILDTVAYTPFLLLFALAAFRCATDKTYWTVAWVTLHITVLATVLTALIFWGSPRFRDSIAPVLLVYAAAACLLPQKHS